MIPGVPHAHLGTIWYHHSESSDVPYSPKQFLGWDFFCRFLQQDGSSLPAKMRLLWTIYNIIKGFLFALIFFVQPSDTHFTLYNLCHKKEKREWKRQQWGQHVIINRRQLNSNLFYGPPHYLHSNRKKVSRKHRQTTWSLRKFYENTTETFWKLNKKDHMILQIWKVFESSKNM